MEHTCCAANRPRILGVRRFGGPYACLASPMSADDAQLDNMIIYNFILLAIKSNPSVEIVIV
ncbi:hypothetical protein PIB30_024146 [Stylosanthes scabra]|uniref:Uncharacterized protein n=1 Tax=Stylosanthes scabra TaxID=79078 RepID=A0ABU6X7R8_9FABA|nr:hypothetical protein [Stylosanthes scabra]